MTPDEYAAMLRLQEQIQREYVKFAPMVREAKDIAAREVASFAPMGSRSRKARTRSGYVAPTEGGDADERRGEGVTIPSRTYATAEL